MPPPVAPETLQHVSVKVGDNQQEIVFANLSVEERMADTGHFSFIWKNDFNDEFTDDQEKFIQTYIGEKISISLDGNYTFKGIILEIGFYRSDGLTQEFNISGQGLAVKLLDHTQSATYYKKTLKDIITDSMRGIASNELSIDCDPKNTNEVFYTVQYNEADFSFIYHLAVRYGEWFYFNGEKLKFGKIEETPYEVTMGSDIFNASLSSSIRPMTINSSSYNNFSGENLIGQSQAPSSQGLLNSLSSASSETFDRSPTKSMHLPQSPTQATLDSQIGLEMNARTARLITFSASSRNANIKLGSTIKVNDNNRSNEYIITTIQHTSHSAESYSNHFTGVPSSVQAPPYTDANWYPKCDSQTAVVKENEDTEGLDRIKVHFPWQQENESTPWIRLQNPYAGKDKGFRFVPEKEEEVLIGFENGNAEKPYVIGAMFNGKAKSGEKQDNNCVKMIGTKNIGRLEFNECDKKLTLADGYSNEDAIQGLILNKKDGKTFLASQKDKDNFSEIVFHQNTKLQLVILDGNAAVTMITFTSEDKKIEIQSKGTIDIKADQTINLEAGEINLNGQKINITGKQEVNISGMKVSASADNDMSIEGMQTKVQGSAQVEVSGAMAKLSGDGITTIQGGIVKIN